MQLLEARTFLGVQRNQRTIGRQVWSPRSRVTSSESSASRPVKITEAREFRGEFCQQLSRKFGFLILRLSETRPCQMPSRRSRETRCAMHFFRGRENSIRRERNEAREIGRVRSERALRSSDLRDLRHPRHAFGGGTSTGGGESRLRSPRAIDDPATKRSAAENSSEIGFHAYRRQS